MSRTTPPSTSRRKFLNSAIAGTVLGGLADIAKAFDVSPSPGSPQQWNEQIAIDPLGVMGDLAAPNLQFKTPVNSFTRRWPYISFLGGMAMGNRSEDLEFFCTEPFKWHSTIFDYVLEDEGDIYGLRARIVPYKELGAAEAAARLPAAHSHGRSPGSVSSQLHSRQRPSGVGLQKAQNSNT